MGQLAFLFFLGNIDRRREISLKKKKKKVLFILTTKPLPNFRESKSISFKRS